VGLPIDEDNDFRELGSALPMLNVAGSGADDFDFSLAMAVPPSRRAFP
jgi:hypothetical protein